MPTINRRVLSNLIELIKPYISESVVSLDNWKIRRGKHDGEGKFTVYPGEEDFKFFLVPCAILRCICILAYIFVYFLSKEKYKNQ